MTSIQKKINKVFPYGVRLLIATIAIDWISFGFTDPFLSTFANSIVDNYAMVGLFVGLMNLTVLVTLFILLDLVAKIASIPVLFFGRSVIFFGIFLLFLSGYFENTILLFGTAILMGVGLAAREVSSKAYLLEHSEKKHASTIFGTNVSLRSFTWFLGAIMSGSFLLTFTRFFEFSLSLSIGLMFLLQLPFLILSLYSTKKIPFRKRKITSQKIRSSFKSIFQIAELFHLLKNLTTQLQFSMLLIFFHRTVYVTNLLFLPLLAVELNIPFWGIGILIALMTAPFIFSGLFSLFEDRHDRMKCIITGLFLLSLPLLFLTWVEAPIWVGIAATCVSLALAFIQPANLGLIASHVSHKEAPKISGLQVLFDRSGWFIGSVVMGFIAEIFSIQITFFIIAILAIIFAITALWIKTKFHLFPLKNSEKHKDMHPGIFHIHHGL